jgi:very-short-patch-repair endonuclease
MLPYNRQLKQRSQEMRVNATPQENKLWYRFLRKHTLTFLRQKPVDSYIADFMCHAKKLIIEIDGSQHYTAEGMEYDRIRTATLEGLGFHLLRFTNDEVDNAFDGVCGAIQGWIDKC